MVNFIFRLVLLTAGRQLKIVANNFSQLFIIYINQFDANFQAYNIDKLLVSFHGDLFIGSE